MAKDRQKGAKRTEAAVPDTLTVNLDAALRKALEDRAAKEERSLSFVARKAIEQYLAGPAVEVRA